jgi:hypothetical protein
MSDILRKLLRKDLRRLKPGDWVAWSKSNWGTPESEDFSFHEAQMVYRAVRSFQYVIVRFNGHLHEVNKDRLYRIMPVISMDAMHTQWDYNA